MYSDLLLPHLKREMIENYFEICCYFGMTKRIERQEDLLRLHYYKSLLLTEPFPQLSRNSKLDLEIISCTRDVRSQLLHTYPSEFIIRIIESGIHVFFDKMDRYAAIDVRLRSLPELYTYFTAMSPVLIDRLKAIIRREFGGCEESRKVEAPGRCGDSRRVEVPGGCEDSRKYDDFGGCEDSRSCGN